jgi:hypothetical protein
LPNMPAKETPHARRSWSCSNAESSHLELK